MLGTASTTASTTETRCGDRRSGHRNDSTMYGEAMPVGTSNELPRRALLAGSAAAGAVGVLTACSGGGTPVPDTAAVPAGRGVRRRAARESRLLLARYRATAETHRGLAGTLAPLQETVSQHLRVLEETGPAARPGQDWTALPGPPPAVPPEPGRAVSALIDAERQTADARLRELATAPPDEARLLASLAAAGATQAWLLSAASGADR